MCRRTSCLPLCTSWRLAWKSAAGNQCYVLANDEDQAGTTFLPFARTGQHEPVLLDALSVKQKMMERKDGNGFLEVLPAGDILGATGRPTYCRRSTNLRGYRTGDILDALPFDAARTDALRGSRLTRAFITGREFRCSICSHKARQCACTHRNLQVTGEESIRNRIGTLRVAQQKTRFAAPRSYLVCPSSSSSIAPKASKGWLPEICRPLMKNVGVPVTPSWAPSIKSR